MVSGYLGAAPSLLWAASALTLVFAPLLIVVSVWLYTLVFGFSALWFTHYALSALAVQRGQADLVDREPAGGQRAGNGEVIDLLPATSSTPSSAAPPPAAAPALPPPIA